MQKQAEMLAFAWVAKLADALDSGSSEQYVHVGSSPVPRTSKAHRTQVLCALFV